MTATMVSAPLVVVLLLAAVVAQSSETSLPDVSSSLGLGYASPFRVAATIDWNGDNFVDLLVISSDNTTFSVMLWAPGNGTFYEGFVYNFTSPPLVSIVTADINRDGRNDALVLDTEGHAHLVYGGNVTVDGITARVTRNALPVPVVAASGLNLAVVFGTCGLVDVIAQPVGSAHIAVFRNALALQPNIDCNNVDGFVSFVAVPFPFSVSSVGVGLPHSASADLNGDCLADIIVANRVDNASAVPASLVRAAGVTSIGNMVLYTALVGGTVSVAQDGIAAAATQPLFLVPEYAGVPTWADLNADGSVDAVFPYCLFPVQIGQPGQGGARLSCLARDGGPGFDALLFVFNFIDGGQACNDDGCCAGHAFSFVSAVPVNTSLPIAGAGSSAGYAVFPLMGDAFTGGCTSFKLTDDVPGFPAVVRATDYNDDTRMDFALSTSIGPVVLINNGAGVFGISLGCAPLMTTNATGYPLALIPPPTPAPTTQPEPPGGRNANVTAPTPSLAPPSPLPTPAPVDPAELRALALVRSTLFFFDLYDDGRIDLLTTSPDGVGIAAFRSTVDTASAYFFTATTLNGVKNSAVGYPAWGAVQVGAVHRFEWPDIENRLRRAVGIQFSSSQFHALGMPRAHFGLAKTFSYVQRYSTGIVVQGSKGWASWPAYLIPNSQVVCLAYPITDPSEWQIKLFFSPSRFLRLVLIALVTSLVAIGIPIVYLKVREVQADRRELKQLIE